MMREKLLIMLLAFFALALEMQAQEEDADVTTLLTNPYFEDGETGWTVVAASGSGAYGRAGNVRPGGSSSNKCYEAWNSPSFDIYQTITDVPVGVYEIEVQGFYRYLRGYNAWSAYQAQESQYVKKDGVPVYVYMNNNATPFVNIFAEPVPYGSLYTNSVSDDTYTDPNYEYWYPNQMNSSAEAFSAGMYKQSAFGLVAREGDAMRVGVKGVSNQGNDSWVIWDNFKLTYRGFKADVIKPVLQTAMADVQEYMSLLMGKTEYAALSTAYRNAELGIENNDGVEMFNALNALYDAKDPARLSKDVFVEQDVAADTLRLGEAIRSVEGKKLSQTTLAAAKALLAGIKSNTLYENGETGQLKSDVNAMVYKLQQSVDLYQRLYQAIQENSTLLANAYQAAGPNTKSGVNAAYSTLEETIANLQQDCQSGSIDDDDVEDAIEMLAGNVTDVCHKLDNYVDAAEWERLKTAYAQIGNGEGWTRPWDFGKSIDRSMIPGVSVDDGMIVALNLSSNNLTGAVPFALLTLPHLQTVNISDNQLTGDLGTAMTAFLQSTSANLSSIISIDLSHNQLSGNIGLFASCLPGLTTLKATDNMLEEVYPTISPQVTTLLLGHQTMNRVADLSLSALTPEQMAQTIPSILLYNHATQSYDAPFVLRCSNEADSWSMDLVRSDTGLFGFNNMTSSYSEDNGALLKVTSVNDGSTFGLRFSFSEGDSNFDGKTDQLDLQSDIDYIFQNNNHPFNLTAADLWKDSNINVQDMVKMVGKLTGDEGGVPNAGTLGDNRLVLPDIYTAYGAVRLPVSIENADEIVALQFDLTLPEGVSAGTGATLTSRCDGHNITVKNISGQRYRVLLYSASNSTLTGQTGTVIYLPLTITTTVPEEAEQQMSISEALLTKATGENVLTEAKAGNIKVSSVAIPTIVNPGFEQSEAVTSNVVVSGNKGGVDYQETGWRLAQSSEWGNSAVVAYGSDISVNNCMVPANDYNGNTGHALGFSAGWSGTFSYQSAETVILPPGTHVLMANVYNANANAQQIKSRFGFVPNAGSAFLSSRTSYPSGEWTLDYVVFTLSQATEGVFQVGCEAYNSTSTTNAVLLFDDLTLTDEPGLTAMLRADIIDSYPYNYGDGHATKQLVTAYNTSRQAILDAVTVAELNAAQAATDAKKTDVDTNIAAWKELATTVAKLETLAADDHYAQEGRTSLEALLVQARDAIGALTLSTSEVTDLTTSLSTQAVSTIMHPEKDGAEMTLLMVNPDFEQSKVHERNTKGWTVEADYSGNVRTGGNDTNICYEAWGSKNFDIFQVVSSAPLGVYEIQVHGFYRYGGSQNALNAYYESLSSGTPIEVPVYVYMNNNATPLKNCFDEKVPQGELYTDDVSLLDTQNPFAPLVDNQGYWYPNDMNNCATAFKSGLYRQSAFGLVARAGAPLRIGVKGSANQGGGSWPIWDDFRLIYRGYKPDVVKPVLQQAIADVQDYIGQLMGKSEYATLTSALNDAEQGLNNDDGLVMFNALNALYDVKDPARESKDIFLQQDVAADTLRLGEAIRSVDGKKLSQATLAAAQALLTGVKSNTLYENDETSQLKSDVSTAISKLNQSVSLYRQLNSAITSLDNVIALAGPDTRAGLSPSMTEAAALLQEHTTKYEAGSMDDGDVASCVQQLADKTQQLRMAIENYIDPAEWQTMKRAYEQRNADETWAHPWDFTATTPSKANVPGVTTDDGHVVALDLSSNNLTGTVPFDLLTLPRLHTLNLSGNSLSGDIDAAMTAFKEAHASELAPLQSLNLSHNQLSGNIGALAGCFPQLTSLNASYNSFEEVSPAIPSTVTNLVLDHQTLDCVVDLSLSEMISASLTTKLPSILLYNHATQRYDKSIRLRSTTAANDWTIQIQKDGNSLPVVTSVSPYVYQGANGEVLSTTSTTDGSTFAIRFTFSEGDSNFDGAVNVLDLQSTINYAFEDYNNRPFNFTAANLWADDLINVQDVVKTVDVLMSLTHDDQPVAGARGRASETAARSGLYIENGNLLVNTEVPVAAFDLMLSAATNITIDKALKNLGITCRVELQPSGTRIIGYSLAGGTLPVGQTIIGKVTAEACIQHALLSDSEANPIGVSIGQGAVTSAGFAACEESGQDHAVYDLSGRKVTDMKQKGIYILRGKKVVK